MRTRSESSIRRKAARDGYAIKTIRSVPYSGELMIVDASTSIVVAGWGPGLDWDEAEAWIYGEADDKVAA